MSRSAKMIVISACAAFFCSALAGYADQFGDFTYVEYDTYIEITDYPEYVAGELIIPSEIVGKPVTVIGERAFYSCEILTRVTIPDSVTLIGNEAFYSCFYLQSVAIPAAVTEIGRGAFDGCPGLTGIIVAGGNSVYSDVGGVLFDKNKTVLIRYPAGRDGSFDIPGGVARIADSAFGNCEKLSSVTIPGSVVTIGESAFSGCHGLTRVTIPDSVTLIGDRAFYWCSDLLSVTIPVSVTEIGMGAFEDCPSLTGIMVDGGNPEYSDVDGVLFDKDQSVLIQFPGGRGGSFDIPEGVTRIGYGAFSHCRMLTRVTIPDSVTLIGDHAFALCYSLTNLQIPDSVTTIGVWAFFACHNLTSLTIPDSVISIGDNAFGSCDGLTRVSIGDGLTAIEKNTFADCDSLTRVTIGDGVMTIGDRSFERCRSLTDIVIPDSVIRIDERAFYDCVSLVNVVIGNSVASIGEEAFRNCSSLTGVIIPDSVTDVGRSAFASCAGLLSVSLGNCVTRIAAETFLDCVNLVSATIGESVTRIEDSAFRSCYSLTGVIIPDGVTRIDYSAFSWCRSLTSVTIPDTVITVGEYAFQGSTSLTSVRIGDGLTAIAAGTFSNCDRLTSVTIPEGVTLIDDVAFAYCDSLVSVYFLGDAPAIVPEYDAYGPGHYLKGSFANTPATFRHFEDAAGFDAPDWQELPTGILGSFLNLSTRGKVLTGDDVLIGGLVIAGDAPMTILVRGIGPGLSAFLEPSSLLSDPVITLYSGSEVIAGNDDWSDQTDPDAIAQMAEAVSAFPLENGSKDAALVAVLDPGAYQVHLSGKEGSGIGLVELYDGSDSGAGRLMNISTRGRVATGASIMIPGFIVEEGSRRFLVRGVGPELAVSFGLNPAEVLLGSDSDPV